MTLADFSYAPIVCDCGGWNLAVTFADGTAITAPFTLNTATSPYTLKVQSSDLTHVKTWNFKVTASLANYPTIAAATEFFDVTIVNPCFNAVLQV